MKLIADESVDQQIVELLRSNGHTVEAIVETCPDSTDDDVVAKSAGGTVSAGEPLREFSVSQSRNVTHGPATETRGTAPHHRFRSPKSPFWG